MKNTLFRSLVLGGVMLLVTGCAAITPPFAAPEDVALNRKVVAALGPYANTVYTSAVGGRIYITGSVLNFEEQQDVLDVVRGVEGVRSVMEELYLEQVGNEGGSDPSYE